MSHCIGIRLEDKNEWERRTPLIPVHVNRLERKHGIRVYVQSSRLRAFGDKAYVDCGAIVAADLTECGVIFAIKEVPLELLEPRKTYVFFSHTVKGQAHNMPLLRRLMELRCQLIDYECIVDDSGRRSVYFGDYAGMAGMIDALWALGQRLAFEKMVTPFAEIRPAHEYSSLEDAKTEVGGIGEQIRQAGLHRELTPLVCGFAGYGNVSRGAQEIFDLMPFREIKPNDLDGAVQPDPHVLFKVVFKEMHMVERITGGQAFDLQQYYDHPHLFRSRFESFIPHMTLLVNGIYWTDRYPRLVTRSYLREQFSMKDTPRLRVIADISCDLEGAIECNVKTTDPGAPVYVYNPLTDEISSGFEGRGVVILAIDNLPAELPMEASTHFSTTLLPFVPEIARADYTVPFDECSLSPTVKRAVITWQGRLTPNYRYLEQYV